MIDVRYAGSDASFPIRCRTLRVGRNLRPSPRHPASQLRPDRRLRQRNSPAVQLGQDVAADLLG
jgi:hypothetical protein